jgi:carbohydrate kinase (thermoresistant glucokinase family)
MAAPPVIVVMGVTGSGKTTIGSMLADALGVPFVDGDDFHGAESVDKMRRGEPLTDSDREPWLNRLNQELRNHPDGVVLACSALTAPYRYRLTREVDGVRFVLLTAPPDVIRARVEQRKGHFAPVDLVESQLALLDPPSDALVADVTSPPDVVVQRVMEELSAR